MEENREGKKNREFVKGVLFGTLISAVCVLAVFLIKNGTVGFRWDFWSAPKSGANVLTDAVTRNKLEEIQQKIEDTYLHEIDSEYLSEYLFRGVAAGLNDPYADYYTAEELQMINEINQGEYIGIGITLTKLEESGRLHVEGVYDQSPAQEAGIQVEDEIVSIDGQDVTRMPLSEATALIKGGEDSIEITFLRGDEQITVSVQPSAVEIPTVSWELVEDGIGYLKIIEFDDITVQQFADALRQLDEAGMKKLVIDLRNNPGGVLSSVCDVLRQILPEGTIVYTEDKNGERETYYCAGNTPFEKPLVVLVNGYSASAAEIFAGAVQDYALGTILGETTYGKGVVQRTYLLKDGSALKLTTDQYFTPKGQDIDGTGITPDIEVEQGEDADSDEQLKRALNLLKEQ